MKKFTGWDLNRGGRVAGTAAAAFALLAGQAAWSAVPKVVGDRGGTGVYAPENTTMSIAYAASRNIDTVVLNVRESSDGQLVVIHDVNVNRTTNSTGNVVAKTLATLKSHEAGTKYSASLLGVRIPTLPEALTAAQTGNITSIVRRMSTDITVAELADALTAASAPASTVVLSEDNTFLTDFKAYAPARKTAALVLGPGELTATSVTLAKATGAEIVVAGSATQITSTSAALVHGEGLELYSYLEGNVQPVLESGVDAVITIDDKVVDLVQNPGTYTPGSLDADIVSYWKLDDGILSANPTVARDSRGSDPGQPVNNPTWTTAPPASKFDGGLSFNGTNAPVVIPASPRMDIGTNQVSISVWVKLGLLPVEQTEGFVGIYDSVEDSYVIYGDKTNNELRAKVTVTNGNAARPGIPASALDKTEWHHVVAVHDGNWSALSGQTRIYMDGVLYDAHTGNDNAAGTGLLGLIKAAQIGGIGRNGSQSSGFFNGQVDDVAIWKRALTPAEVHEIYAKGQAGEALSSLVSGTTPAESWSLFE